MAWSKERVSGLRPEELEADSPSRQLQRRYQALREVGLGNAMLAYLRGATLRHEALRHPFTVGAGKADLAIFDVVTRRHFYELGEQRQKYLNGLPVIDLGANIGAVAASFATQLPDSKILAVEPHPRNVVLLRQNASRYGDQIQVLPAGYGQRGESLSIGFIGNALSNSYEPSQGSGLVPALDLGQILQKVEDMTPNYDGRIGVVKVNIVGSERRLFEEDPALDHCLDSAELVIVETHDHITAGASEAVWEALDGSGFTTNIRRRKG